MSPAASHACRFVDRIPAREAVMDRRDFHRTLLAGLTGALAAPEGRAAPTGRDGVPGARGAELRVDGARLQAQLDALSAFGDTGDGGVERLAYTEEDRAGRAYVAALMRAAGLAVVTDAIGNLIGRRDGREALPPIATGSHIDSVPRGGRFDGNVGVLAAVEAARVLHEAGIALRHPLEVIVFQNEENGKIGSRALRGEDPARFLDFVTHAGRNVREGIAFLGGDPGALAGAVRAAGSVAAFVELHIEQGGVLEAAGVPIGVVEGIVGIKRWNVTVEGFANHAGTTPMDQRRDALLAAARFVDAVNAIVRAEPGRHVGTVGSLTAEPGAANVIAGRARLTLELRDLEMPRVDALFATIAARAHEIGRATGTRFALEQVYVTQPAVCSSDVRAAIAAAAVALGLATRSLPSGAGHDAQEMAYLGPMGMIFVPSRAGISHSPLEYTAPDQIEAGANVLLHTLLRLDAAG
jgi:N-carbamoyl-L-amino-acid hydrolase